MTDARQVLGRATELDHVDDFLDQVTALWANDVAAQNSVGFSVC